MTEIWVEISETAGRYSVSSFGNVRANWSDVPRRNLQHRIRIERSHQLKPSIHTTGYLRVALGRGVHRYVHRLVAEAFRPNPENLPQVDHIDGNPENHDVKHVHNAHTHTRASHMTHYTDFKHPNLISLANS